MPLHPQAKQFLGLIREAGAPPLCQLEPPVAREASKRIVQLVGPSPAVVSV
jgi:hypothetical protein